MWSGCSSSVRFIGIGLMEKHSIDVAKIGELTEKTEEYLLKRKNGDIIPLRHSDTDEITKIF